MHADARDHLAAELGGIDISRATALAAEFRWPLRAGRKLPSCPVMMHPGQHGPAASHIPQRAYASDWHRICQTNIAARSFSRCL